MILRHSLALGLLTFALAPATYAQSFQTGDNVAGLMLGIGGHYGIYSGGYTSQSPALGVLYERATGVDVGPGVLGLGGYVGYKQLHYNKTWNWYGVPYEYDYNWTYTIIGFRGAYHWNEWHGVDKLDTYGGLMLSYNIVSYSDNTTYPYGYSYSAADYSSSMGLSLFFGTRYYLGSNFAVMGELGWGIAYLNIGAAFKF